MQPKRKGKRTTKVNNQLESKGGNHVYARRKLNPKSTTISDCRRSLRLSKTPVKTGITSLSRCSEPHTSRGCSSAPEEIQEPDVPAPQAINMAYQVSGQIQPLRYLVSDPVAHPPTMEQELGQKEARNVENSTVDVPEMMEEEDKAENSLSNHSKTEYSPQVLSLKPTEPELGQKEARNVENSTVDVSEMMEEEDKDESSHSRTGCSPRALSLKLTEPELGQKEARTVENSTVDVPEMMEEEDKAENSLSNHSKTEYSPQVLSLKPTEPEVGQKEARNVENSTVDVSEMMEEEDEDESSHSRTGCSPRALSLKLTEPELGQKEARTVENSTVDVPEMMEEEDKAENSLSNHLKTGCSPQALSLKLIEPDLGQKEARNVENSTVDVPEMMEEEDKDGNSLSNHSRAGCSPPAPAYSQRLTELAAMAAEEDDDDEVDSEVQSRTEDSVNEYKVKKELIPILRKVIGKHGDIAKNCPTKLVRFRSALLGMICEIVSELEKQVFTKIKIKDLETMISEVDFIKKLNVEVQWLHSRLTNILEAKRAFKQTGKLKEKIDIKRKSVDFAESAMEDCEAEIKKFKDQIKKSKDQIKKIEDQKSLWKVKLAKSQDEFTLTYNETISATAKINRFCNSSLVDDLL